jgi:hypothetical protein
MGKHRKRFLQMIRKIRNLHSLDLVPAHLNFFYLKDPLPLIDLKTTNKNRRHYCYVERDLKTTDKNWRHYCYVGRTLNDSHSLLLSSGRD